MSKPTILVDMDGPIAAFDQRVFEVCRSNGWQLDCTWEQGWKHRFLTDHMERDDARALRTYINESRFFRDLDPTPGAIEGLAELDEVANVWICTKPLEANVHCRDDKAAWVRDHLGVKWEERLILAPDKSMVVGDILLDDAIKPSWLERSLWLGVVFPVPFNQHPDSQWADRDVWPWTWTWGDPVYELVNLASHADALAFEQLRAFVATQEVA